MLKTSRFHLHTIADPFLVADETGDYLFVEEQRARNPGEIWVYELTGNGLNCLGCALAPGWHVSYPQVFKYQDKFWMLPESARSGEVCLYEATKFPMHWKKSKSLLRKPYCDSTLLAHAGKWWLFCALGNDELHIYHAEQPYGDWVNHRGNPFRLGANASRGAGAVIRENERLYRPVQDCNIRYGGGLKYFEILELSEAYFVQKEIRQPLAIPNAKWNTMGSHHISVLPRGNDCLVAIDGQYPDFVFNRLFGVWHRLTDAIETGS